MGQELEEKNPRGRGFLWGVIVVAVFLLGFYVWGGVMLARYGGQSRDFGWRASARNGSWTVTRVDPAGAAAGQLELGDRILSIAGDRRVRTFGPSYKLWVDPPEGSYSVLIQRGDGQRELRLGAAVLTRDRGYLTTTLPLLAASLAFYVISTLVGLLRPTDRLPQLLVTAGFPCGAVLLLTGIGPWMRFLRGSEALLPLVIELVPPFHLVLGYRFFYWLTSPNAGGSKTATGPAKVSGSTAETLDRHATSHPRGAPRAASAPGRFWTVVYHGLWACGLLIAIPHIADALVWALPAAGFPAAMDFVAAHYAFFGAWWRIEPLVGNSFGMAALLGMFGVLAGNYRRIEQPDQKRRIKWIVYGTAAGVLPPALVWLSVVVEQAVGLELAESTTATFRVVYDVATAMPILVPLALGHAVAKHRILGIEVVVRRGIQYLLARNGLRAILLLPTAGLVYTIASNPDRTVADLLFGGSIPFYLLLLASGMISLRYRAQVGDWLDRRFFRERYDQEKVLLELIENVKECDSLDEISRLVSSEIGAALHPKRTYVFYRDPQRPDFALSYSSSGLGQGLRISEDSDLLRFMERQSRPLEIGRVARRSELSEPERAFIEELGVDLIVPMRGPVAGLTGLLLLGEKKSEEPYSAGDKQLLQAIAGQIAVVCENLWLKDRVARDSRERRDVLAHLSRERVNLVKECPTCGSCFDRSEERCSRDRSELLLTLPVERTIEGRYRLERLLGRGGMGAVYDATDSRLSRRVAVKIMMGHLFGERTALRRFEREARASANLSHPNIIAVHDYGRIGEDGAFLVMELIEGVTLRAEIQRRGRIGPRLAADWFDQMLEGLTAAHGLGVIHRDLKPENVMITPRGADAGTASGPGGSIKILDFGLAKVKLVGLEESRSLTVPGTVLGTCAYMSPEQLRGGELDERSDLFSVGVMVVEALTGRRPFQGADAAQMLHSMLHQPLRLEGSRQPVRTLEVVLRKALATDRRDRFASAWEVRQALIPALRHCTPLSTSEDLALTASSETETRADYRTR